MKSKNTKKIHIIGSVGSGKTTLARKLSSMLHLPHYELDNVVWERSETGDIRRTDKDRDAQLNKIMETDEWILEGVHHKWVSPSFQQADMIIFLDTNYTVRNYRIIKRYILQKFSLEKANYKPTFHMFRKMFVWNSTFEKESKPEIMNMLKQHNHKLIVLKDTDEIKKYL